MIVGASRRSNRQSSPPARKDGQAWTRLLHQRGPDPRPDLMQRAVVGYKGFRSPRTHGPDTARLITVDTTGLRSNRFVHRMIELWLLASE
jgi:hypothetical protein